VIAIHTIFEGGRPTGRFETGDGRGADTGNPPDADKSQDIMQDDWPFKDRTEAGRRLGKVLAAHKLADPVVLALPRGGVPVAVQVARILAAPLDLLMVRKIGVPSQPELALGAIVGGRTPAVVINDEIWDLVGMTHDEFDALKEDQLREIERRRTKYLGDRKPLSVEGKTAIIVDDGIATGATIRVAVKALRQNNPARIVIAVPVAPPETVQRLRQEADDVVCLEQPVPFYAISLHYGRFDQLSDEAVVAELTAFYGG
jgi:putative phosphoribosyl transferase